MGCTRDLISDIYFSPLPDLVFKAQQTHRRFHDSLEVQLCTLSNIKSGNCSEDCSYCPQSAHNSSDIEKWSLPTLEEIKQKAENAKMSGSQRFCMGAAWREVKNNNDFEKVLEMIRLVNSMGMETCVTLGMLTLEQAKKLKEAGLTAYNHNIDTSPEYYPKIVTTRTFEDRLQTIKNLRAVGIELCCGGIIGLGESVEDRVGFIQALTQLDPPPEYIPINALVPVKGTPLESQSPVDPFELVRTIATVRISMPQSIVRLAAGRTQLSDEAQALCFLAGANSIFTGEKLLTTPNPGCDHDHQLLAKLGMKPMADTAKDDLLTPMPVKG